MCVGVEPAEGPGRSSELVPCLAKFVFEGRYEGVDFCGSSPAAFCYLKDYFPTTVITVTTVKVPSLHMRGLWAHSSHNSLRESYDGASRASPTRQAKDTSRACPSPARRRIPISGHKIPILTIGYLPPPLSGGIRGMGQPPCTWRSAPGPLAVRCQRHSDNHTPNHTGRVIL